MEYRKEIDGLRALAVIPVIFFHAGIPFFEGGYVGVDIFYVISGYLITSLILSEKEAGKFSLAGFYERRARRILPALFLVMLACIPFAFFLMMPNQLKDFSESILAVSLFASNFLFWLESDYFSPSAELKPLLHTWSLAVEEQFYILFPLFLLAFWSLGKKKINLLIICLLFISLSLSEWSVRNAPTASFFLTPSRAWEILLGVTAAFVINTNKKLINKISSNLALIGVFFIGYSIFFFEEETPFPGIYALLPTLGTVLILLFSSSRTLVGKIFSINLFVGVGLISYGAYLWHQPLLAFMRLYSPEVLNEYVLLFICLLSFVLAYLSWRFIEKPFRDREKTSRKKLAAFISIFLVFFISFSTLGIKTEGFIDYKLSKEDQDFLANYKGLSLALPAYKEECNFYFQGKDIDPSCYKSFSEKKDVLIWGDSHAQALGPGLRYNFGKEFNFVQVATSDCYPKLKLNDYKNEINSCSRSNAFALEIIKKKKIKSVILAQRKDHIKTNWKRLSAYLKEAGVEEIFIVGPTPQWVQSLPNIVAYYGLYNQESSLTSIGLNARLIKENKKLESLFEDSEDVTFVSIIDYLCKEKRCLFKIDGAPLEDNLVLVDDAHLSVRGSNLITETIFKDRL